MTFLLNGLQTCKSWFFYLGIWIFLEKVCALKKFISEKTILNHVTNWAFQRQCLKTVFVKFYVSDNFLLKLGISTFWQKMKNSRKLMSPLFGPKREEVRFQTVFCQKRCSSIFSEKNKNVDLTIFSELENHPWYLKKVSIW